MHRKDERLQGEQARYLPPLGFFKNIKIEK
jgi:hypothetical protein